MRALVAEFLGTFLLVFAGTGAIIVNAVTAGAVGHVGIVLTFGLVVTIGIVAFGATSGAHFNPAVTLGLAVAGCFAWSRVPAYIAAECLGAIAASLLLRSLFPGDLSLVVTVPKMGVPIAFAFEVVMTFILVAAILGVIARGQHGAVFAPLAIGGAVALDALFGGLVSGASMNPARSLGPALVAQIWTEHWIYWLAPLVGGSLATLTFTWLNHPILSPDEEIQGPVCLHPQQRAQPDGGGPPQPRLRGEV